MCVTDRHDIIVTVEMAVKSNTSMYTNKKNGIILIVFERAYNTLGRRTCFVFSYFSKSCFKRLNPLPDNKFYTLPKLKEFADNIFKFDENGRKLSKWVETL